MEDTNRIDSKMNPQNEEYKYIRTKYQQPIQSLQRPQISQYNYQQDLKGGAQSNQESINRNGYQMLNCIPQVQPTAIASNTQKQQQGQFSFIPSEIPFFNQNQNQNQNYNNNYQNNYYNNTMNMDQKINMLQKNPQNSQTISAATSTNPYQNYQALINKESSGQQIQQHDFGVKENQEYTSPLNEQKQISDLQLEIANLKKEMQKQALEKDDFIFKLTSENRLLRNKVKEYKAHIMNLHTQSQQQKQLEEQKQQRRQRQREEIEIQRQYAYMIAVEQMEQVNQPNNQQPNVDNMTYEELLNLQDQIGFVSKGMKEEDVNKIKEIKYDKDRMHEFCHMCSVCQTDFDNSEKVKQLNPCQHIYHSDCINQWLQNEKNCPVCKQMVHV